MTIAQFEQGFGAEPDAGVPARSRLPYRAHGDADEEREHQGFEIGLAGEVDFDPLQQDRRNGNGDAQDDAGQKLSQLIDQMQLPGAKSRDARLVIRPPIVNAAVFRSIATIEGLGRVLVKQGDRGVLGILGKSICNPRQVLLIHRRPRIDRFGRLRCRVDRMANVGRNRHDLSRAYPGDPENRFEEELALQNHRYLFAWMAVTIKPTIRLDFEISELRATERDGPKPRAGFVVLSEWQ